MPIRPDYIPDEKAEKYGVDLAGLPGKGGVVDYVPGTDEERARDGLPPLGKRAAVPDPHLKDEGAAGVPINTAVPDGEKADWIPPSGDTPPSAGGLTPATGTSDAAARAARKAQREAATSPKDVGAKNQGKGHGKGGQPGKAAPPPAPPPGPAPDEDVGGATLDDLVGSDPLGWEANGDEEEP